MASGCLLAKVLRLRPSTISVMYVCYYYVCARTLPDASSINTWRVAMNRWQCELVLLAIHVFKAKWTPYAGKGAYLRVKGNVAT